LSQVEQVAAVQGPAGAAGAAQVDLELQQLLQFQDLLL
jgi:hypothetical protein